MSAIEATRPYRGRFAPSPTGPLHAGSLTAALASWLDARAHAGRWLVRIEDVDLPRCRPGAALEILRQLAACGLVPDAPPERQSTRTALYQEALARLVDAGWAYPCACSRADIAAWESAAGMTRARDAERVYPGTCRFGTHGRQAHAVRARVDSVLGRAPSTGAPASIAAQGAVPSSTLRLDWHDRRLGAQRQDVARAVGDFVLKRADGLWSYQFAVVVDDAAQGITHVVRGDDLTANTPRQIHLQRLLGLSTPRYLHTPLVRGSDGEKLSKRNGALPVNTAGDPLGALVTAGRALGIDVPAAGTLAAWLEAATGSWAARYRRR